MSKQVQSLSNESSSQFLSTTNFSKENAMNTRSHTKTVLTFAILTAAACANLSTNSAQAAITLVGLADFSVTSSGDPAFDAGNQLAPASITPSTTMPTLGAFPIQNIADGLTVHQNTSWASDSSPGGGTVTLTFPSDNVAGMTFNWAWGDRTPGDYEIVINGTTSLGTFNVDGAGGTSAAQSTEPITHILFDSVQTNVTSIDINMSYAGVGNTNNWGSDEIEVYTGEAQAAASPEPSTAILAVLGIMGLVGTRRRRQR